MNIIKETTPNQTRRDLKSQYVGSFSFASSKKESDLIDNYIVAGSEADR